jgi:2-keto-4-pentenoate hydratase
MSDMSLAETLTAAVKAGTTIDKKGLVAPDVAGAYAVQAAVRDALGLGAPQGYKFSLREGGLYGAPLMFVSDARSVPFEGGVRVEIELSMTLARDLPPRTEPYSRDEVVDAIGSAAIGVELVRTRYVDGPGDSLTLLLADTMSNIGYIVGPQLDRSFLAAGADFGALTLTNGDTVLFDGAAKHPDGDPLAALVSCANGGLPMGGHLKAGDVVTTGTLCGAPYIAAPSDFTATFGGQSITVSLTAK